MIVSRDRWRLPEAMGAVRRFMLLLVVLALCARQSLCQGPPSFSAGAEQEVYVFEVDGLGEKTNLSLSCVAMGDPTLTIAWFREGVKVDDSRVQEDGSFLVVNITEGEYASADGTEYYCTATNDYGTIRSRDITVYYASFGGFVDEPAELTDTPVNVTEGDDVALYCGVVDTTTPPPQIVWYSNDGTPGANDTEISSTATDDNKYYRDGGRYLVILDLTTDDIAASYRCGVTNARVYETEVSNIRYVLTQVTEFPEVIFFYKNLENKTGLVGDRIEFTIVAASFGGNVQYVFPELEGAPADTLDQVVSGEGLADIDMIPPDEIEYEVQVTVSVLGIADFVIETVYLSVQEKAAITTSPEDTPNKFTTDRIEFICETSGRPTPSIQFYYNGQILVADGTRVLIDENNLTISSAVVGDTGMYQCFVWNEINTVQEPWALRVREPEAPAINMTQAFNGTAVPVDCRLDGLVLSEPPGESAVIQFVVTGDPCPDVTWSYNDNEIVFNENNTLHLLGIDPCPDVDVERPSFTFDLTVTDVTEGEGLYSAVFKNRAGSTTSDQIMVVPEAMAVVVSIGLVDEPCLRGDSIVPLRIKCETSGYPEPEITFFKGTNSPVDVTSNTSRFALECDELVIANADVVSDDGGTYGCEANNGAGASATVEFTTVFCNVPTVVGVVADKNPSTEGDTLMIRCTTSGTPPPDVVWQRVEDNVVTGNISLAGERVRPSGTHPNYLLTISDIEPDDAGVYRCLTYNMAGNNFGETRIEVEEDDEPFLSTTAIIGISAGGAGLILVIILVVLLLVCVYMCARRGQYATKAISTYQPGTSNYGEYTDGRGNVDRESDEEEVGETEAFEPQYQSLPVMRPPQPPTYKPTPSYPHGVDPDDMEMIKVPPPDTDSEYTGTYPRHGDPAGYRPGVDDFLSEDAQFV